MNEISIRSVLPMSTHLFLIVCGSLTLALQSHADTASPKAITVTQASNSARSILTKDTRTLRKYAYWCASNPQQALSLGRCDSDSDGISNKMELSRFHTSPTFPDTDGDGRSDRSELLHGTDPLVAENDGGCYPLYFYPKNKITNKFNIPKGVVGSIPRGAVLLRQLSATYPAIKSIKTSQLDFPALRSLLKKPPFNFKLQGDSPTITTSQIADLLAVLNKDKLHSGACSKAPENPTNPNCTNPFASNGDTSSFGIPAGLIGNRFVGADFFSKNSCTTCHSNREEHGLGLQFQEFVAQYEANPSMIKLSVQQYADLVANANRESDILKCEPTPAPTPFPPGFSTPTPTATSTAQATPTSFACTNQYFDMSGKTTTTYAQQLKIPSPPGTGDLKAGLTYFNNTCLGCHTGGLPASALHSDYQSLQSIFAAGVNKGMPAISISSTNWANLTALANIDRAPTNCGGTPTPVPTLSAYQWGYVYSSTVCSDCHTLSFQRNRRSISTISEAINEETAMQGLLQTDTTSPYKTRQQKISELSFYLNCLVNGGSDCF